MDLVISIIQETMDSKSLSRSPSSGGSSDACIDSDGHRSSAATTPEGSSSHPPFSVGTCNHPFNKSLALEISVSSSSASIIRKASPKASLLSSSLTATLAATPITEVHRQGAQTTTSSSVLASEPIVTVPAPPSGPPAATTTPEGTATQRTIQRREQRKQRRLESTQQHQDANVQAVAPKTNLSTAPIIPATSRRAGTKRSPVPPITPVSTTAGFPADIATTTIPFRTTTITRAADNAFMPPTTAAACSLVLPLEVMQLIAPGIVPTTHTSYHSSNHPSETKGGRASSSAAVGGVFGGGGGSHGSGSSSHMMLLSVHEAVEASAAAGQRKAPSQRMRSIYADAQYVQMQGAAANATCTTSTHMPAFSFTLGMGARKDVHTFRSVMPGVGC